MKKIIITGALGHIGSALIRHFPEKFKNTEFVLIDNLLTQRYCSLFDLPKAKFTFVNKDILKDDLSFYLKDADALIHLAAITDAANSFSNQNEVENVNFEGTKKIAHECLSQNVPMIFLSTTSVYGTQNESVDENCGLSELKPQSPYAESKLNSEQFLKKLSSTSSFRFVTCRFGTIFGTSIGMRFHTAINKFCWQACMGESVTVWKTALNQYRPYLDLKDAVNALIFILENRLFDNDIYNVLTVNATVEEILAIIKIKIPNLTINFVDTKIMNQLSYHVKGDKFINKGFRYVGKMDNSIFETINLFNNINLDKR